MDRLTDLALYRKARALGAYWDAVVHRAPTPPLPAEDAELGALIRRMHGAMGADLRDTSPGDPLLTNLLAKHQEMNDEMNILSTTTLSLPVRTVPTPRTRSRPSALPDASRPWPDGRIAAILVAAAFVVLAVGLVLGPLDWRRDVPGRRTAIPAAVATDATPATGADRTLVEFPFPADVFPDGGRASIGFRHFTVPANSSTSWNGASGEVGPGLWGDYIVSGSLTMTSEAVVDVIRGGTGIQESVPAGTEIELAPGDTVLHRIQHSKTWVAGPETVNIVSWYVREMPWATYPQPGGWTEVSFNLSDNTQIVPGANMIRILEALMQPDVRRPDPEGDAIQIGVMLPQDPAYLIQGGDLSLRVANAEGPVIVYILTIEPTGSGSASPAAGTPEP